MGVFAQGTVLFQNRAPGDSISQVYAPQVEDPYTQVTGNTATDLPAGSAVYTGAKLAGADWTAQLWAAPGANASEDSLAAALPTTTFRTGAAAGWVVMDTITLPGVPADAPVATLQMRVFPTSFATWEAAEAAWLADSTGTIWIGKSPTFNLNNIGGIFNSPPVLTGLQSFSLVANIIPEPSTFALLGLGALGMFLFRRK